jgi:hypothetical protein
MTQQASTYSPNDAIALVKGFGHGIPLTVPQANLCDTVNSKLWTFFPWSWSLSTLTAITLVNNQQDYTPTDANILRPVRMRIVRTDLTPNEFRELDVLNNLAPELTRMAGVDSMMAVGWMGNLNKFRFDQNVQVSSGNILQLQGEYQKLPIKITDSNMGTVFPFPDHFYDTFVEGLKWKIYQLSDDPRAGNVVVNKINGQIQYSGQLGVFMDSLMVMARTEDLSQGDGFMFPTTAMGNRGGMGPNLFGFG